MQYNFSLFWGIAIQMYESTLRADQTPLDKYLAGQKAFSIPANNVNQFVHLYIGQRTISLRPRCR